MCKKNLVSILVGFIIFIRVYLIDSDENFKYQSFPPKNNVNITSEDVSERTLIARLEEENGGMLREMEMLKQQQVTVVS
ncbi:unnamed protein product [Thelazia callipaeda]|uniref:Uncharacterized protein n=1 Tax=Thelazia callipaeda TaxID=103827 RepID=A0A0N5CMK7_THECL|nr:unnamed protein product [Thelazia callipaeda]